MSSKTYVQNKVIELINSENIFINSEHSDDDLAQHGMDSIVFIMIIVKLEDEFKIEMEDEYLLVANMNTVNKITDVVFSNLVNIPA